MNLDNIFEKFKANKPATESLIPKFEVAARLSLPEDYKEFLCQRNGGEGFVGDRYLVLFQIESLKKQNDGYNFADFFPGLLLIGSDGAGEAFAFDTTREPWSVVMLPFIGFIKDAKPVGKNFEEFLLNLANTSFDPWMKPPLKPNGVPQPIGETKEVRILYSDAQAETLSVTPLGNAEFLLEESSGLKEARWHDLIELNPFWDRSFEFVRIARRSGYRVEGPFILKSSSVVDSPEFTRLLQRWSALGCNCERPKPGIFLIHIPPGGDANAQAELHETISSLKEY